ncbi:predicted protein, partial [Nematostella vectensis]
TKGKARKSEASDGASVASPAPHIPVPQVKQMKEMKKKKKVAIDGKEKPKKKKGEEVDPMILKKRMRQLFKAVTNYQTCPNGADWRNEQCTTQGYPSQYYMSHAPCTLYCRRGNVAEILGPVADGTPCYRAPERRDVCIEGKCRIVGCDYSLDSGMDVDRCGKCAGDGSECVKVTKMYTDQSHTIKGNENNQLEIDN